MPAKPTCANCDQRAPSKQRTLVWCHPRRDWREPGHLCKLHPARRKGPAPEEAVDAERPV